MIDKLEYLLTPGQLLIMYGEKYLPRGAHHIGLRIDITSEVDESCLRQALVLATYRIPSMNIRIKKNGKNDFTQYVSEENPLPVDFIDATGWSQEKVGQQLMKWCGMPFSNDLTGTQLYRMKLLRMDKSYVIFVAVHHVLMDAYAIMSLITYIDKVYQSLVKQIALPLPMLTPELMIEKENQYHGSKRYEADKKWFEEMYRSPLDFRPLIPESGLSLKVRTANPITSKGGMLNLLIPKAMVEHINDMAAKYQVSPGVFYMLAIRSYLAHSGGNDDVVFIVIMSRRATILQKKSGCSIANALPFRNSINSDESFEKAIPMLSELLHEIYRHSNFSCEEAFAMLGQAANSGNITAADPIAVTYQPYFDMNETSMNFTMQRVFSGKAQSRFYLSVMPCDSTGNFYGNYEFLLDAYSYQDIQNFHNFMLKFLEKGLEHPEMTVRELTDLSL